jgi:hypothetical protein
MSSNPLNFQENFKGQPTGERLAWRVGHDEIARHNPLQNAVVVDLKILNSFADSPMCADLFTGSIWNWQYD